ncbi:MAG TPA: hypothetical protein VN893_24635 [Bryobacteraceae bacterium]|nr:hypothetical protein [Bryobacteraceae bacterium]
MWTRKLAVVVVIAVCLCMIGCTQSQVINDIDIALSAAQVAIPIVAGAAGLPAAQVAAILTWIQAAVKALGSVSNRLSVGGSTGEVAAGITADLAGVAASVPDLQGVPASIAGVVQTLATDIQKVLATYGAKPSLALSSHSALGARVHFGRSSQERIAGLKAKGLAALVAVEQALAARR